MSEKTPLGGETVDLKVSLEPEEVSADEMSLDQLRALEAWWAKALARRSNLLVKRVIHIEKVEAETVSDAEPQASTLDYTKVLQ